jgi:hypothetical protein
VEVTPASYGVSIQAFHFWYVISPTFPMEKYKEGEARVGWDKKEERERKRRHKEEGRANLQVRRGQRRLSR